MGTKKSGTTSRVKFDPKTSFDKTESKLTAGEVTVQGVGHGQSNLHVGVHEHFLYEGHVRLDDEGGDRNGRLPDAGNSRSNPSVTGHPKHLDGEPTTAVDGFEKPHSLTCTFTGADPFNEPEDETVVE